jgi:hypothetical protein
MMYVKTHISKNYRAHKDVIAIDFDGTLSYGKYPACGPGNEALINLLRKILAFPPEERNYFVLWTSRTGDSLQAAIEWLGLQGLVFDSVNELPELLKETMSDTRKIPALYYVDDRAIRPEEFIKRWGGACDSDNQ